MSDLKQVLTDEIRRLARKEVKIAVTPLQENIIALKKQLSESKKTIADLSRQIAKFVPAEAAPAAASAEESAPCRISGKGIKKMRDKKKVTQGQLAALLGVTLHTVSMWESGRSVPRKEMKAKLCAIRGWGKRELAERLAAVAATVQVAEEKAPAAEK